ncbi:Glyoxalase/Bleomycin resistance protein/Dihydroxybiphenyl dioxygenase [Atractiella rhizophila]|nr:Glyoxalase/Bleomycin resistance protein/Dihydroxybiphenyl dioxygenase [Atractiella rhizophila]
MTLSHLCINVSSITKSVKFYTAALSSISYIKHTVYNDGKVVGYAPKDLPEGEEPAFWLFENKAEVAQGLHYAFVAKEREEVDAFHKLGLKAGGTDNGKPGLRDIYGPHYYAAYLLDPDGINVEVLCQKNV